MTPIDAAYNVVSDYPGGAKALAVRLGKNPATLAHEVKPGYEYAKLGLDTAVRISQLTGDHRILFAFANDLGYRCVLTDLPEVCDADLALAIASFSSEVGESLQAVHVALADARVTENEVKIFERQVSDIWPRATALASALRRLARKQSAAAVGITAPGGEAL